MLVIKSIADVKAWLRLQPHKTAVAFSARAALRALPALASAIDYWMSSPANERGIVEIAFEFASTAWSSAASEEPNGDQLSALHAYAPRLTLYVEQAELLFELQTHDIAASAKAANACGFATSAAAASGIDAATFASKSVEAAISTALHTPSAFHSDPAEAEILLQACAADATLIEQGWSLEDILAQPLWITNQPEWTIASWEALKLYIRSQHPNLERWIVWYEQCLLPPSTRDCSGVAEDGPDSLAPDLALRPAMIQPVWHGDWLTLADAPLFDLGDEALRDLLSVLHEALSNLVTKLTNDSNCDPRMTDDLDDIAG